MEPDPAGSLIDARPPQAVILSAREGSHINWRSTLIDLSAARFAGELPPVFAVRDDKARDAVQLFIHVYAGSINERFHF